MKRHGARTTGVAMLLGAALVLVAACGSTDSDTGGTTTTEQAKDGTATGDAETTGTEKDATTGETATGGTETSTAETSTTTEEAEPTLADGSGAVLELVLGRLDSATQDGRSQCLLDAEDVAGQAGLHASNRPHMLADGYDVWVVCLTGEAGPDGATLSLTDSAGTVWGQGVLYRLPETEAQRGIGFSMTGAAVRPVTVTDGVSLVPVGFSYEREGHTVTTLMVQVPTTRPPGPWTIAVAGADSTNQFQMDTPACQPAAVAPVRPWPIRPDVRVITFVELDQWISVDQSELIDSFVPVGHCLATPLLYGQTWDQAVNLLATTRASAVVAPADTRLFMNCDTAGDGTVRSQQPEPNGDITEFASLSFDLPCPAMADVVGLTVEQAEQNLAALQEPPFTFSVQVSPECKGPGSVVRHTYPPSAGTSYRTNGTPTLPVELFCDPEPTGNG